MERTKQRCEKKESREKRSPLQDLNGFTPIHKINSKKSLNPSAPSRNRKPTSFSKLKNDVPKKSVNTPNVLLRSEQNEIPRKPFLQKSKNNPSPGLYEWQSGKRYAKPTSKSGQRSKLSICEGNPVCNLTKGSEEFEANMKNSQDNCSGESPIELFVISNGGSSNYVGNCNPLGKIANGSALDFVNFDVDENGIGDSILKTADDIGATAVKTPPVEASVSPDIQCASNYKMLVSKSTDTPVCYGTGHHLSGVKDKRKCRRRGSLRGGCEKVNLFYDDRNDGNVVNDPQDSSIPLLAEGSVRWLLSPCDEGHEDPESDSGNMLDQCRIANDNASKTLDLLSSPSMLCESGSELVIDSSSYNGSVSVGNVDNEQKTRITIHSLSEFQGFLEPRNNKRDEFMVATSPNSTSCCKSFGSSERKHFTLNLVGNNSASSIGTLSSGNVIQTPNSDSSSELCVRRSNLEAHQLNFLQPNLGSISKTLTEKNVDCISSWVSDSTLENLALSQMRISWRDGILASRNVEVDEFDYCLCVTDEEIDDDGCSDQQLMSCHSPKFVEDKENVIGVNSGLRRTCQGTESGENEENNTETGSNLSPPMLLEYEPCISARGKEKLPPHESNTCAESICTSGGELVASGDSDWSYCHHNYFF